MSLDICEGSPSVLDEVIAEFEKAQEINGDFASLHEAWAVLYEEVNELWEEVRKKERDRNYIKTYKEAVQVSAVALRLAMQVKKLVNKREGLAVAETGKNA